MAGNKIGGFNPSAAVSAEVESSAAKAGASRREPATHTPGFSPHDTFQNPRGTGDIVQGKGGTRTDPPPPASGSTGGGEFDDVASRYKDIM